MVYIRVDDHDLSELAMRSSRAVQEHGIFADNWHIKGSNFSLAIDEGDVAAVNATLHGHAGLCGGRLCDSVVAR